jgi:DNA mismatch endonuclease Vsr
MADRISPEKRRTIMQAVKSKGSGIERSLAKALFSKGLRYRKNDPTVFGKPDLTFKKYRIAVFADSEFWHGKNWEVRKLQHKSNVEFWTSKIERNMDRDRLVNETLASRGWIVIRFWGEEIVNHVDKCTETVFKALENAKNKRIKNC